MEKRACKNTSKKPIRRSQTRRASQGLLHYSASSSSSSSPPPPPPPSPWGDFRVPTIAADWCNYGLGSVTCSWTSSQVSSSMVELLEPLAPLPRPEPTWSTTAPVSRQPTSPPMEVPEFQWGDNQDSSYTWWLGFLKSLDDEINNEESVYPSDEEIEMEYFRQLFCSLFKTNRNQIDPTLDNQSSAPDEWLTVPETENHSDVGDS